MTAAYQHQLAAQSMFPLPLLTQHISLTASPVSSKRTHIDKLPQADGNYPGVRK